MDCKGVYNFWYERGYPCVRSVKMDKGYAQNYVPHARRVLP